MKLYICLFTILFSIAAVADNWYPVGKTTPRPNYSDEPSCESAEGQHCFDVSPCPIEMCSLDPTGTFMQTDPSKVNARQAAQSEHDTKETKAEALISSLKTCVTNWATLTATQKDQCELGAVKLSALSALGSGDL